jgi:hypothetical protein
MSNQQARMAQWIRRLPTEQEILGSSPSTGFLFFVCLFAYPKKRYSGRGLNSRPSACKADVITTRLPEQHISCNLGVVAQMVERTLSMREAQGSIPCYSTFLLLLVHTPQKKKQPMGGFEPPTFRLLSECSTPKLHWLLVADMVSPCGAMDSASDFGSGGWGFESPQGLQCFFPCVRKRQHGRVVKASAC